MRKSKLLPFADKFAVIMFVFFVLSLSLTEDTSKTTDKLSQIILLEVGKSDYKDFDFNPELITLKVNDKVYLNSSEEYKVDSFNYIKAMKTIFVEAINDISEEKFTSDATSVYWDNKIDIKIKSEGKYESGWLSVSILGTFYKSEDFDKQNIWICVDSKWLSDSICGHINMQDDIREELLNSGKFYSYFYHVYDKDNINNIKYNDTDIFCENLIDVSNEADFFEFQVKENGRINLSIPIDNEISKNVKVSGLYVGAENIESILYYVSGSMKIAGDKYINRLYAGKVGSFNGEVLESHFDKMTDLKKREYDKKYFYRSLRVMGDAQRQLSLQQPFISISQFLTNKTYPSSLPVTSFHSDIATYLPSNLIHIFTPLKSSKYKDVINSMVGVNAYKINTLKNNSFQDYTSVNINVTDFNKAVTQKLKTSNKTFSAYKNYERCKSSANDDSIEWFSFEINRSGKISNRKGIDLVGDAND